MVVERAFFKDYQSAQEFFKKIEFIDYVCFQYEQGASGNKHLQGFMHFSRPMDFKVVKRIFPTIHLDRCNGSNSENRAYCMKENTKIAGYEFFEHGLMVEERQRTDIINFKEAVKNNMPFSELLDEFPHHAINSINKIPVIQQKLLEEKFGNIDRDMRVSYIYGQSGVGKTTFPRRVLGMSYKDMYKVSDYGTGKFDGYLDQDMLIFDEFLGQLPITFMNDILRGQPASLPARFTNRVACFTKVLIISNYPLDKQYQKERADGKEPSFEAFLTRFHEIIHVPERNVYSWEKGHPSDEVIQAIKAQDAKCIIDGVVQ